MEFPHYTLSLPTDESMQDAFANATSKPKAFSAIELQHAFNKFLTDLAVTYTLPPILEKGSTIDLNENQFDRVVATIKSSARDHTHDHPEADSFKKILIDAGMKVKKVEPTGQKSEVDLWSLLKPVPAYIAA